MRMKLRCSTVALCHTAVGAKESYPAPGASMVFLLWMNIHLIIIMVGPPNNANKSGCVVR